MGLNMGLKTENFFKSRVLNSKISIIIATTCSVLIMGILGLIAINYNSLENTLKENVSFNLIINNSVEELEAQQLIKSISLLENIKSVNFVSKDESAKNLINNLGENFLELLEENPLSDIIEVKFFADFINTFNQLEQKKSFLLYDEIDDVLYDGNIISLLENNFQKLSIILLFIALLFFFIAFVLINSNIRLTIYAKRFNIKTMQLVGATKKFIQTPFLISNLKSSMLACFLGNFILTICIFLMLNKIPELQKFITLRQITLLIIITSLINLAISFFSTWFCVRKYLNLKTEELYK